MVHIRAEPSRPDPGSRLVHHRDPAVPASLYGFIIVDLGRREVVRIGVTPTPSAQYAAQSFIEAVCDR